MSFQSLRNKISKIKQKIKTWLTIYGFCIITSFCLVYAFLSFILDYFLQFPIFIRAILLLSYVSGMIFLFTKYIFVPLKRKIDDEEIIKSMEKNYPELKETLISGFQFRKLLDADYYKDSPEMTKKVIEEAEKLSERINFTDIIKTKTIQKILTGIIFLNVLVFTGVIYYPRLPYRWYRRNILLKDISWPKRTNLFYIKNEYKISHKGNIDIIIKPKENKDEEFIVWYRPVKSRLKFWLKKKLNRAEDSFSISLNNIKKETYFFIESSEHTNSSMYKITPIEELKEAAKKIEINFPDTDILVNRGSSFYIKVVANGKIPNDVKINYKFSEGSWQNKSMRSIESNKGVFIYNFLSLSEKLEFYFTGGDDIDELPKYRLDILNPPSIDAIYVWYKYPEYTKQKPTPMKNPQPHSNINAIQGTDIVIGIKTNVELQEGKLIFDKKSKILSDLIFQDISPFEDFKMEPNLYFVKFKIKYDTKYKIDLIGKNGLLEKSATKGKIQAIKDYPPFFQIINPVRKNINMTSVGNFKIKFNTKDDYGIKKIGLIYKINKQEKSTEIDLTKESNLKEIFTEYNLDLSQLETKKDDTDIGKRALKEKDKIYWHLKAEDNNNISGPNIKISDTYVIDIKSKTGLLKILDESLQNVKKRLSRVLKMQNKNLESLEEFLDIEEKFEKSDKSRALNFRFNQKAISRDLDSIRKNLREIIESANSNNLWDTYTKERINKVYQIIELLSYEKKPGSYSGKSADTETFLIKAYEIFLNHQEKSREYFQKALVGEKEISKDIKEAITLLVEWEDVPEIIQDLRSLLEQQEKLLPKYKKLTEEK